MVYIDFFLYIMIHVCRFTFADWLLIAHERNNNSVFRQIDSLTGKIVGKTRDRMKQNLLDDQQRSTVIANLCI